MSSRKTRTRFAPSPTGFLHIGSLRTTLYAYLLAKHDGGDFILRLEDTDQKRAVEGAEGAIIGGLEWAGLIPDEGFGFGGGDFGPYRQTLKKERYQEVAEQLLESGQAYYCFCSAERLQEMREKQQAQKLPPRYDRKCADIPLAEARARMAAGEPAVIRFRLPDDREVVAHDLVRGEMKWHTKDLQDMVLVKSDGMALYHLAATVDDIDMEITHVLRGEEWISSLPIHLLLHEALGNHNPPLYAHLPNILNNQGKKLSKRHDDVSLSEFIKKGVLPEAMINFIALLGWNPGQGDEREIFSLDDLVSEFDIKRVHKAGAIFDNKKLENINAHWIRSKTPEELSHLIHPIMIAAGLDEDLDEVDQVKAVATVQERMRYLSEAPELLGFYFQLPDYAPELLTNPKMKVDEETARRAISVLLEELANVDAKNWSDENLRELLLAKVVELDWKNGQMLWPMRAALTGEQFSPGAFEVAGVLGRDETLRRLEVAQSKLK